MIGSLVMKGKGAPVQGIGRKLGVAAVAAVAVTVAALPAGAAVTFDPATGTGSADRADVAAAFGWSTGQFNQRAAGLTFSWFESRTAPVTCWFQIPGNARVPRTSTTEATSSTETEVHSVPARTKKRVDFTGYGATVVADPAPYPAEGEPCTGSDEAGTFQGTVLPITYTTVGPALFAHHGGRSVPLT